jgi:hypothetical protein
MGKSYLRRNCWWRLDLTMHLCHPLEEYSFYEKVHTGVRLHLTQKQLDKLRKVHCETTISKHLKYLYSLDVLVCEEMKSANCFRNKWILDADQYLFNRRSIFLPKQIN